MKHIWMFFFVAVSVLISSTGSNAAEWVEYDGEVPEDAVTTYNEDTASEKRQMPVCRYETSVGFLGGRGVCNTVGQDQKRERYKEDFHLLISSEAKWALCDISNEDFLEEKMWHLVGGKPICRYRRTVGWLDIDQGVCNTVGTGGKVKDVRMTFTSFMMRRMTSGGDQKGRKTRKDHDMIHPIMSV